MSKVVPARYAVAGFNAQLPSPAVPQLQYIGEEWLASRTDIADHAHETWEVYLQLDGEADWHDRAGATTLGPGDGYLSGPGVRHHLGRVRGLRHHFVFAIIDADAWVATRLPALASHVRRARSHGRLFTGPADALRTPLRLLVEATTRATAHRDLALATALDALCVAMFDWAIEPEAASLRPEHPAVALVRERVDRSPGRRWTLAELAAGTGMTPKHLCTVFGRQVGQTPHQYLLAARLAGIKHALADTDLSITQLAEDYGFASSQHLARVFAARIGSAPRAFRAEQRRMADQTGR
ncbi:MAG: helix-turn-helix transcriptional regulator [Planctomycetes bacterium]|nr:helix-turn-helix transcriptional regulator [Planctomycetota bacterium]